MQEIDKKITALKREVDVALKRLDMPGLCQELDNLNTQSARPDLWEDRAQAEKIMSARAKLVARVEPWQALKQNIDDLAELASLNDASLRGDLSVQLGELENQFANLKNQLKLSGPLDDNDAILSIYAGAGGTDAQDWAAMLLRMYQRWAEQQGYKTKMIEESVGEEAGLKSATLDIAGSFVYGKLKGEHGVHRLVRLSPFNADNLRQTSFAKVEILPKIDEPGQLVIDEKDLKIDVYRSGGRGGQSVNTTDSAVRITHLPTGIVVAIQNERSQLQNKETAMTILRSKLAALQSEQHLENIAELKGPNQSAEWGNQIRSYVLHPYKQVKDLRTNHETSDPQAVLDGGLEPFIEAYLDHTLAT